ncbi:MAG: SpvB/TcaC N-terminal domain-containing protein [Thiobacillus sp.]|nr:SpvB/TcaC N-terminal domain-containing protein [Thiobacillus sp.]
MRKLFTILLLPLAFTASLAQAATTPGAIPGSFGVSESGAATYTIPIAVPPGTGGIEPKLSLAYNSQGGNGLLGMGWSLSGLSVIHRCPRTVAQDGVLGGVNYDANDRYCLDGQRLVAISGTYGGNGTEYRTEIESYSRIVSYGSQGSGPSYWKVWTKSGQIIEFGNTNDSRIEAQGKTEVMLWSLNKLSDTVSNTLTVSYIEDNANGQFYPDRIDYTGNANAGVAPYNSVRFVYETRPDVTPMYQAGSLSKTTVRLTNVQVYAGTTQSRDYRLVYGQSSSTQHSRLSSLTECEAGGGCLSPTLLEWPDTISNGTYTQKVAQVPTNNWNASYVWPGDYNGDGKTDILSYYGVNLVTFSPDDFSSDFLISVTTGLSATTTLTYKPLTDPSVYTKGTGATYPVQDVQAPMYVVAETATDDGVGGQFHTAYRYAGARSDLQGRGFLGFATLERTDLQTGIVSRTNYSQVFPTIGMPTLATKTTANGVELSRVENTLTSKTLNAGKTYLPYVSYSKQQGKDLNAAALPFSETWNTYDDWGNLTQSISHTSDGFKKQTDNTYTNDITNWFLGRLTRASVASTANGVTQTRVSAFEYATTTGLLTKETIEPDQPQFRLDTVYTHDAFGNRKTATVSSPATGTAAIVTRTTTTTYDAKGQFPITVANALGHSEAKTFDARFGSVVSLTGPNGLATSWQYDGFGRKTRETRADGTFTQWTYDVCDAACPANGVYRIVTQVYAGTAQVAPSSVAYFDQLNRAVRSATQGFDGRWIYKDTVYDNQGRTAQASRPYYAGEVVYWATSAYDDLGRTINVFEPDLPDTSALSVAYNGLTISRSNRKGQTTTEVQNSQGQKVSVTDAMGNITGYAYDPFGNLTCTTDLAGNQIVNVYNLRGRKTQTTDPDLGLWKYEYNALGELVKQTDAKSQLSTMAYDKLGRMVRRLENGLTSDWIYDTAPTRGTGKLYQAKTSAGYVRTHYYDNLGRPQSTLSNLGAGNPLLYSNVVYDTAGRVSQQAYSSGFATKQVYNAYGYLAEVRNVNSNALYWRADQMDAAGHLLKETYGNGIVTDRSYYADTGRTQNIVANTAGGQQIQGQAYVYDTIGNLTVYADGPGSQMEIRGGYDDLNRLKQIDSTINGIASSQVLVYDALGNISSKTGVGSYYYGGNANCVTGNGAGRHAVCRAGSNAYSYDANGNLGGGGGRSITWTAWNMPSSLTQSGNTSTWSYGPEHDRYKMVTAGRTTWYLNPSVHQGGHFERTQYTSGTIENRHTLYGGGRPIGEIITFEVDSGIAPAAQTRYFHSDQQGSITAVTDSAGTVITRYRYDPWGKQTLVSGSNTGISQTRQGHTGHEMLDGGLTHMNGRLYDPVLSRFVSADSYIQSPYDLQSFNRYSYVFNNPMGNTDPTGYFSWKHFLNPFASKTSFIRNALPGWEYRKNPYVQTVGIIVAAYFIGPLAFNSVGGTVWGAVEGVTGSQTLGLAAGVVAGGAASGAAVGAVAGGVNGGWSGAVQGAKYGAIGGAIGGSVSALYSGSSWGIERVAANSLAGGVSSAAQGGSFKEGALFSAATSAARYAYNSFAGYDVSIKPGDGPASPKGNYEFTPDGLIPKNSAGNIPNVIGLNAELVKNDFWANLGNQGAFPGNVLNYALAAGNAIGVLHDTAWEPYKAYFNAFTNWGTMVPAAVVTYGAVLDASPTRVLSPYAIDRMRR